MAGIGLETMSRQWELMGSNWQILVIFQCISMWYLRLTKCLLIRNGEIEMSNVSTVGHVQNRLEMQCFVVVLAQTCPNKFMYQYKSTMSCCEAIRSSWRCLSFAHPDLCNDKEVVRIALRCLTSPRIWVWGNCGEIGEITPKVPKVVWKIWAYGDLLPINSCVGVHS